jgi:hypothetical protein
MCILTYFFVAILCTGMRDFPIESDWFKFFMQNLYLYSNVSDMLIASDESKQIKNSIGLDHTIVSWVSIEEILRANTKRDTKKNQLIKQRVRISR